MLFSEEHIEFVRPLNDVRVTKLPTSVTFECEVSKPRLSPLWFKDEQPIRSSRKYDITSEGCVHTLVLKNVETMDEADYTVRVKSIKSTANLCIQGNDTSSTEIIFCGARYDINNVVINYKILFNYYIF